MIVVKCKSLMVFLQKKYEKFTFILHTTFEDKNYKFSYFQKFLKKIIQFTYNLYQRFIKSYILSSWFLFDSILNKVSQVVFLFFFGFFGLFFFGFFLANIGKNRNVPNRHNLNSFKLYYTFWSKLAQPQKQVQLLQYFPFYNVLTINYIDL